MALSVLAASLLLSAQGAVAVLTVSYDFFADAQCSTLSGRMKGVSGTCEGGDSEAEPSKKTECNGDSATTYHYSSTDCSGSATRSDPLPSTCTALGDSGMQITCKEEVVGPVAGKALQEIHYESAACGTADISRAEDPLAPMCFPMGDGGMMYACDSDDSYALMFFHDAACQDFAGAFGGPVDTCAEDDGVHKKRLCIAPASFEHVDYVAYASTTCEGTRVMEGHALLGCIPFGEYNETTSTWTPGSKRRSMDEDRLTEEHFESQDCSGDATHTDQRSCGCNTEGEGSYSLCGEVSGTLARRSAPVSLLLLAAAAAFLK